MKIIYLTILTCFIVSMGWAQDKQSFTLGSTPDTIKWMTHLSKSVFLVNLDDTTIVTMNIVNKHLVADSPFFVKLHHHALLIYKNSHQIGSFAYYTRKYHIKNTIIQ